MRDITSPLKEFPGTAVLYDPLSLPMVVALESAISEAEGIKGAAGELAILPGLLGCVQEMHIEGLPEHPTVDTWPGSPRKASLMLLRWLTGEIMRIYAGEKEIPNA